jgi:hypothetical protein
MTRPLTLLAPASLCAALAGCDGKAKCDDCFEQGFRVVFQSETQATPPPALLFSGFRNGWCQRDFICTGSPDVFLGDVKGGAGYAGQCEKREAIAFAGAHAPTPTVISTSAEGQNVSLKPPVQVPLTVWIVNGVTEAEDVASDIKIAAGRYADLGTGITFPDPRINSFPRNVPNLSDNASCLLAPLLVNQPGFDADRVNVYYVEAFRPEEGGVGGLACADLSGANPPLGLVDGQVATAPTVLAHELGHVLGLLRAIPLPSGGYSSWGHTNEVYLDRYLASDNLMRSGGWAVEQITLGQIYRMHFDELSWLWYDQPRETDYPRTCQESPVQGGTCPALTRHPPRAWP